MRLQTGEREQVMNRAFGKSRLFGNGAYAPMVAALGLRSVISSATASSSTVSDLRVRISSLRSSMRFAMKRLRHCHRMGTDIKLHRCDDVARLTFAGWHDLCSQRQRAGGERDRVMAVSCVRSSLEIASSAFGRRASGISFDQNTRTPCNSWVTNLRARTPGEKTEKRVTIQDLASNIHSTERSVDRILVDCCSPRGFTQDDKPEGILNTFFEAVRWAPSAFNSRQWRFLYAFRGLSEFEAVLAPLIELNQSWARHATAVIYPLSRKVHPTWEDQTAIPARISSTAQSPGQFAKKTTSAGWTAHGVSGFDMKKARRAQVPAFAVEVANLAGRRHRLSPIGQSHIPNPSKRSDD